jgi:hypothetical protein
MVCNKSCASRTCDDAHDDGDEAQAGAAVLNPLSLRDTQHLRMTTPHIVALSDTAQQFNHDYSWCSSPAPTQPQETPTTVHKKHTESLAQHSRLF